MNLTSKGKLRGPLYKDQLPIQIVGGKHVAFAERRVW